MLSIEEYLDKIMESADLTNKDGRRVRGELENHIQELLAAGESKGLTESEVVKMIEKEFGSAEELGKMIAKARGKFLTYVKKQTKKTFITLAVVVIIALGVRAVAFEAFRVTTNAVSSVVPINSRVLVNKLEKNFEVDDVIVFRPEQGARIGLIKEIANAKNGVVVTRKGEEDMFVGNDKIVGRALFIYHCKL